MPKTAFFDMDGTIVAPVFQTRDGTRIGFISPEWESYCNSEEKAAYKNCVVIEQAVKYAIQLKLAGWDVKILTVTMSKGEKLAKAQFIHNKGLNAIFDEIISVENGKRKIEHIKRYAQQNGLNLDDCMLVEDNMLVMLQAIDEGIRGMHISHIVTGAFDASK